MFFMSPIVLARIIQCINIYLLHYIFTAFNMAKYIINICV